MPTYVYKPLHRGHIRHRQCIRLVRLLPGSKDDQIQICIYRVSVQGISYPRYEALSYCWGDTNNLHDIEIVSQDIFRRPKGKRHGVDPTTLGITANLASALVYLRRQNRARILWIDAICLDQENNEEKTRELGNMGSIYAKAKNVVIWLGTGSGETAKAFRAMSHLGDQVRWVPGDEKLVTAASCDKAWRNWKDSSFVVPFDYGTWLAIEGVISSPWFRRVWIWQEICLANPRTAIIQCGPSFMPWQIFLNAVAFFENDFESGATDHRESFKAALKEVANLSLIRPSPHLLGLLGVTRRCNCTDPKDRIYGLLGLATQANETELLRYLQPSSVKSASQVYRDFATGEIQIMHRLSILWHCDAAAWNDELPTWVPVWNKKLPYQNLNLGVFGGGRGALELTDSFGTVRKDVLEVNGVVCDTVRSCSATAPQNVTMFEVASMIRTCCLANGLSASSDTVVEALCHALTAGYVGSRYPEDCKPADLEVSKAIVRHILALSQDITSPSDIPLPKEDSMLPHMANTLPHRKLFLTETGRIGLGPSQARSGDRVVSIIGSKRLMLLRPEQSPGDRFKIVGLCYLNGFMDLEAVLGPLPKGFRVRLVRPFEDPWNMRFLKDGDGETKPSRHDPRLERHHEGWQSGRRSSKGSIIWDHVPSGSTTKSTRTRIDPRHTDVEFLRKRGVAVRQICIV